MATHIPPGKLSIAGDRRARHILIFAQNLDGGGVERAMLRLSAGWIAAGRRVTLVVGDMDGPLAGLVPPGVVVDPLGSRSYRALVAALPRRVLAYRPDAIFCAGNHYTGAAAWLRLRLGRHCPPIVGKVSNALVRGDMGALAVPYARWLRLHPRFLDAVVAMTPAMAREAAQAMGFADVTIIPNPPPGPAAGGAGIALPAMPYLVGVGRLAPQKRWDRAVAALARLPGVPLVLLGEGPLRDALAAQAAAAGVADRLHMPGHVADPLPVVRGAAALVLTSDYEGVPGVIREALSVGTPVVSTPSSVAIPELLPDPLSGTIVPADDPAALVAALAARLAPGAPRPRPAGAAGDPAADYLALFDSLVSSSSS